jgi:hypothetical protein
MNTRKADELKSSGLKATLPRLKILEVFEVSTRRHLSAEDVYKALLQDGADIGLATVYRVLMQFEQAGLLSRSNFESGKSVFELNAGEHHDRTAPACDCAATWLCLAGALAQPLRDLREDRLRTPATQISSGTPRFRRLSVRSCCPGPPGGASRTRRRC